MTQKSKGCGICKNEIGEKEEYVYVSQMKEDKILNDGTYHIECYKERINRPRKIDAQAHAFMQKANNMLSALGNKMGYEEEDED